jgi:glycosyltransferase involved in cell wall biosynthesis
VTHFASIFLPRAPWREDLAMAHICMVAFTDYAGDPPIRREAEALVQRGDVVDLICPRTDWLEGKTNLGGVNLHYARTYRYGHSGPLGYLARYAAFLVAAGLKVGRLSRRYSVDVVQVHTMPDFLVFTALPAKRRGAKVILDVHDLVPELYASKFGLRESHPLIRALVWVERRSIAFADVAFAVHDPHRDALIRHGNPAEKLTVIMNSPDLRVVGKPRDESDVDPSLLVYHGTIARRHGLETAVRAVGLARRELPDLSLFIAGDGDDVARIEALVEELGLDGVVTLRRGMVPLENLLPTIRRAAAAVMPVICDSFTRYMLPVKLLEYAALGIPAIVTRLPAIEAYFDESAVVFVDPEDPHAVARRIVELHNDPARARSLAANAAEVVARHSWEEERRRYFAVIDRLLEYEAIPDEADEKRLRSEMQ